jgi:hypothetical protein
VKSHSVTEITTVKAACLAVTCTVVAGAALASTPADAASHHAATDRAVMRLSTLTTDEGGTFRMQTTCPEPSRSTRLESNLFASPVLLPARISQLVSWTVDVGTKQRPGEYWISLNCFQLLTGRVVATAEIRVRVTGTLPERRAVQRSRADRGRDVRSAHRSTRRGSVR